MKLPASPFLRAVLYLICGALMVPAQAPWHLWPFLFAGLSFFFILLSSEKRWLRAALMGWLFGFGYFCAGLWWIANALLVPGNPFLWVWPLAIAGLPALLAFFTAGASALTIRLASLNRMSGFLFFIAAFSGFEWLRGHIFTGFPWNMYGYAWGNWLALAQTAAIAGAYGLTLLTIFWAALPGFLRIATLSRRAQIVLIATALASFGSCVFYGQMRLAQTPTALDQDVRVVPVQANISQADKWDPEKVFVNVDSMLSLSLPDPQERERKVTFLVWPETALSWDVLANNYVRGALKSTLAAYGRDVYLLTGLLRREPGADSHDRYYNSMVTLDRDLNVISTYDKYHLVPFGEYIPLQNLLPMKPFVRMLEGFSIGPGPQTKKAGNYPSFSPLICYEIIFPHAVTTPPGSGTGAGPAWIVNITNDAWYGDSPGPRQHFSQARFRAIEEGLPVVRAANTGISGIIDPLGRVLADSGINERAAPGGSLPRPLATRPPYARWGDAFFFMALAALLVVTRSLQKNGR